MPLVLTEKLPWEILHSNLNTCLDDGVKEQGDPSIKPSRWDRILVECLSSRLGLSFYITFWLLTLDTLFNISISV